MRGHNGGVTSNGTIARSVVHRVLAGVKGANWDQYSPTWRSGPVYEQTGLVEHRNALDVCVYVELRTETSSRTYPDHRTAYAHWSRLTLRKGCGNCAEMAAAAFTLALEEGARIVEYAEFEHFDHAFCILGRARGSDLSRPASWGSDCWICDPWAAGITGDRKMGAFEARLFPRVARRLVGNGDHAVVVKAREEQRLTRAAVR